MGPVPQHTEHISPLRLIEGGQRRFLSLLPQYRDQGVTSYNRDRLFIKDGTHLRRFLRRDFILAAPPNMVGHLCVAGRLRRQEMQSRIFSLSLSWIVEISVGRLGVEIKLNPAARHHFLHPRVRGGEGSHGAQ